MEKRSLKEDIFNANINRFTSRNSAERKQMQTELAIFIYAQQEKTLTEIAEKFEVNELYISSIVNKMMKSLFDYYKKLEKYLDKEFEELVKNFGDEL